MQKKHLFSILAICFFSAGSFASSDFNCVDDSRECVLSAATSYLNALVTHDPSHIPMKDDIHRWENGINTGTNAESIRDGLKNDIKFRTIQNLRDVRWLVDGQQAIAYYLIDAVIPNTKIHTATTHVVERFQVEAGKIAEIEAIFCTSLGSKSEESKIPSDTNLSIQCNRA